MIVESGDSLVARMTSDEDVLDSLDVFTQQNGDDVFLDSLEPTTLRGKFDEAVGVVTV